MGKARKHKRIMKNLVLDGIIRGLMKTVKEQKRYIDELEKENAELGAIAAQETMPMAPEPRKARH